MEIVEVEGIKHIAILFKDHAVLQKGLSEDKKNFVLAHISYYYKTNQFHFKERFYISNKSFDLDTLDIFEAEANEYALNKLVPLSKLKEVVKRRKSIKEIAIEFNVPEVVIIERIKDL